MADKDYIERGALLDMITQNTSDIWSNGINRAWWSHAVQVKDNFVRMIKDAPAADVVEVVRCKDCVCFKQTVSALFPHATAFICDYPYGLRKNVSENDYCCYGERKEQA